MPTPSEKKALLFFGIVIVLGAGARGVAVLHSQSPVDAAARNALDAQIQAVDSVRRHGKNSKGRRGKKKSGGATHLISPSPFDSSRAATEYTPAIIDLDIASAAEIETIRGIGPALAARIVADRDSLGPFGSIEEVTRVRGIGKRLAARIASQVTFSLLPRHPTAENDGTSSPPRSRRKSRPGESHK